MKWNPNTMRWELWWTDRAGQSVLVGWVAAEVSEEERQYWYRQQLDRLLSAWTVKDRNSQQLASDS